MSTVEETSTNREQREYWDREGEKWAREPGRIERLNGEFGSVMLDAAQLRAGELVLDVGCGTGATTVEAAARVAPRGTAVGIDFSRPLLAVARQRIEHAGHDKVDFIEADAQVYPFEEDAFDVIVSRFGTMFFEDPGAAFLNLARTVRPGGRMAIVCWQDVLLSEWTAVIGGAAATHLGFPDFGPPGAPGPYAFADGDRLKRIVESGGFHNVILEGVTRPMLMGRDVDDVVGFFTSLELVAEWFASNPQDKVEAAIAAVREALASYSRPEGVIMSGSVWLVTARR
jgi:SAM-dependent methyltransferase